MSETPELPPLPEPAFKPPYIPTAAVGAVGYMPVRVEAFTMRLSIGPTFTPEQVAAYGRECWDAGRRAGLEEAAKLCMERSRGAPEAMAAEAMLCAAHIRAKA